MLDKAFDEISRSDIDALIADEVVEEKRLDYKEALPGDTEKDKNRFVEDVCSFANAAGGHIIFGLKDKRDDQGQKTGKPEYVGLPEINIDQEKLRLEHIILNKVEPRIPAVQFRVIEGFDNGPVMVMRIPRSFNSPHMTKHSGRFYSRTNSGKYAMDVQEIRHAFFSSEALPGRIRRFRADRLAKVLGGETPTPLSDGPKMILHVVPVCAFAQKRDYDLSEAREGRIRIMPVGGREVDSRYNFDGLLAYALARNESRALSYAQLFRDGTVENVDAHHIQRGAHERVISCAYEEDALSALRNAFEVQQQLGVEWPSIVMLTLLTVRGYSIKGWDMQYAPLSGHDVIDRDDLIPDAVLIEQYHDDLGKNMRPVFDAVANAAGWPRSMNYDQQGSRVQRR